MLANNETGAVQPVAEAAEIVHAAGGLLHVDAIQAFGKIPLDINAMNADLMTLSAHKIGGPKGVGALVLAEGVRGWSRCCGAAVRNWAVGQEPRMWRVSPASAPRRRPPWPAAGRTPSARRLAGPAGEWPAADAWRHRVLRSRSAVTEYHSVHGSRPEGRNSRDRVRSGGNCGIFGVGLFVRQGAAVPCAGGDGIRRRNRPGSGAAQYGLVHVRSGR